MSLLLSRAASRTIDALLIAGDGGRPSPLDRLRDGPYLRSGAELSRAIGRLDEVRVLTLGLPTIDHVPPGRVTALARFATVARAQAVARMPLERRTATLLACREGGSTGQTCDQRCHRSLLSIDHVHRKHPGPQSLPPRAFSRGITFSARPSSRPRRAG
jgi:hypothetical protein